MPRSVLINKHRDGYAPINELRDGLHFTGAPANIKRSENSRGTQLQSSMTGTAAGTETAVFEMQDPPAGLARVSHNCSHGYCAMKNSKQQDRQHTMIRILCIGKMKDKALQSLSTEYLKRISPFSRMDIVEVKDEPNTRAEREAETVRIRDAEAQRVLAKLRPADHVVLLDLGGRMWNSEGFAQQLDSWQQKAGQKGGDLVFVIAGSLGPGTDLVRRADVRWKLSDLTFTHLLTRVLILEQIYRAFMILHGRTYHK